MCNRKLPHKVLRLNFIGLSSTPLATVLISPSLTRLLVFLTATLSLTSPVSADKAIFQRSFSNFRPARAALMYAFPLHCLAAGCSEIPISFDYHYKYSVLSVSVYGITVGQFPITAPGSHELLFFLLQDEVSQFVEHCSSLLSMACVTAFRQYHRFLLLAGLFENLYIMVVCLDEACNAFCRKLVGNSCG